MSSRISGLTQVWMKEKFFHRRKRERTRRRLERYGPDVDEGRYTVPVSTQHSEAMDMRLEHTGVSGGEAAKGVGDSVDTAGAPVSPRISAPRLDERPRGRVMAGGRPVQTRCSR